MFAKANGLSQRFMAIFIPRLALIASKFAGGTGFVSATYFTGRESFSQKVGLIAGVVLATSVRIICEARWAHIDMLFGVFFSSHHLFRRSFSTRYGWKARNSLAIRIHGGGGSDQGANQPAGCAVFGSWRKLSRFLSFAKAGRWRWSPGWPCSWRPSPWPLQSVFSPTSTIINRRGRFRCKSKAPSRRRRLCTYMQAGWMTSISTPSDKIPVLSWLGELEKVREQAGAAYLLIEQRDLKLLSELGRKKCWLRIPSAATPGT
jgi:hypothetical protein